MSMVSVPERLLRRWRAWRRVLWFVSLGLICLAMLYARVAYNARESFRLGEDAYSQGEFKRALTSYERTIKWYTPWSPVILPAIERLWQLGTEAEARDDLSLALEAYQTLRSSLYAVQSVYIPYQAWIPKSEARLAPLLARMKVGTASEQSQMAKIMPDAARFATQLQRQVGPHLGWALLVELSFVSWVGVTIRLIWSVLDEQGNLVPMQGILWGSMLLVCFALWLISMRLA